MQDRPIYCGNFDYDATAREVEKLFERYGQVERVDMKTGTSLLPHAHLVVGFDHRQLRRTISETWSCV
jgi:RNA recognition motif-containing protein